MVNIIPNNNEIYSMTKDFLKSDSQQGCKFLYITYDGRSFSVKGTDNKDDLEGVEIPQSLIDKFMDKFSIEITDQKTSTESKEEITRLVNCKNKLSKAKQSSSIFAPVFSAYGYLKSLYTKKKPESIQDKIKKIMITNKESYTNSSKDEVTQPRRRATITQIKPQSEHEKNLLKEFGETSQDVANSMKNINTVLGNSYQNLDRADAILVGVDKQVVNNFQDKIDLFVNEIKTTSESPNKVNALNNFNKRVGLYLEKSVNKNEDEKLIIVKNALLGVYDKNPEIDDISDLVDYSSKEFISAATDLETLFGEGVSHFIKHGKSYEGGMDLFFYDVVQMYEESGYLDPSLKHLSNMVSRSHMLYCWHQWGGQNNSQSSNPIDFIQNDCAMMSSSMFDSLREISNHMNGEYPKIEDLNKYTEIISEAIWDDCNYFVQSDCIKDSDGSYKNSAGVNRVRKQFNLFFGERDWDQYFDKLNSGNAVEIQSAIDNMKEKFRPFFREMTKQWIYAEDPNWEKIQNSIK